MSTAIARPIGHQPATFRWKDLLLGPPLQPLVLPLSLAAIGLITWANLRGVRESGRIFAAPTYLFVGCWPP